MFYEKSGSYVYRTDANFHESGLTFSVQLIGIVTGFLVLAVCSQKRARMQEKITNFFSKKKLD